MAVIDDICSSCGERNPTGSQFCLFCGVFLGWDDKSGAEAASAPSAATNSPAAPRGTGGFEDPTHELSPTSGPTSVLPGRDQRGARAADPANAVVCPTCGRPNELTRRFCGKCGTRLHAPGRLAPVPAARTPWWRRWWQRLTQSEGRASRRAYRRSLPAVYRWRRISVAVLAVLGMGLGVAIAGHNPVGLAKWLWHELRGDVVQVEGVSALTIPSRAVVPPTTPAAATDGSKDTAWTTKWAPPNAPPTCGASRGSGRLQLTLPSTRLRQIRVVNGVIDPSQRTLQLLPKTLHITTSDGTCVTADLTKAATSQVLTVDTKVPVTSVTISVAAAYPAADPRAAAVVSLSEVSLWARPS